MVCLASLGVIGSEKDTRPCPLPVCEAPPPDMVGIELLEAMGVKSLSSRCDLRMSLSCSCSSSPRFFSSSPSFLRPKLRASTRRVSMISISVMSKERAKAEIESSGEIPLFASSMKSSSQPSASLLVLLVIVGSLEGERLLAPPCFLCLSCSTSLSSCPREVGSATFEIPCPSGFLPSTAVAKKCVGTGAVSSFITFRRLGGKLVPSSESP